MGKTALDIFTATYLGGFNPERPFVWELRLPYSRFVELENIVETNPAQLTSNPTAAIVYLAEWYKWRKRGKGKQERKYNPSSDETRQLLIDAGIDIDKYVAVNQETGWHYWLYSIYVLGGLPICQELERKTTSKLLRNICLMFHGANVDFSSEITDVDRAEAFRKSLQPGGALHAYIKEIIEGGSPFSPEDTIDNNSQCSRLIARILNANKEARKDKFDLRWNILCPNGSEFISRGLLLWLLPEISGVGLSQYLMYDRVEMWNISNPRECKWLTIGVRFLKGDKVVAEIPETATYTNTGIAERGFVCWGVENAIMVKEIPIEYFDRIVIFVVDNNGNEGTAQTEDVPSALQFYRSDNFMEWTSRTAPQRETAVFWSKPWRETEPIPEGLNSMRRLRSRKYGESEEIYNFTLIPDHLTLEHPNGETRTFFNHQGFDILTACLHQDIIEYEDGDKVKLIEYDEEEELEEENLLPLLFTRDDLIVERRGSDDQSILLENPISFAWKNGSRYVEWTDDTQPPSGKVKIRCEVRGRLLIKEFIYLGGKIIRDMNDTIIHFPGGESKEYFDQNSTTPLKPTTTLNISLDRGTAIVKVWLPLNCKEINKDSRCWERVSQKRISVPAISCDRVWVAIFDEKGYRKYKCEPLVGVYSILKPNERINHLSDGRSTPANKIDSLAPECLDIVLARLPHADTDTKWLLWDYMLDKKPVEADYTIEVPKMTLLFQNRTREDNPVNVFCPKRGERLPFKVRTILKADVRQACFENAARFREYFSAFLPLNEMTAEQFKTDIYEPLLSKYNGFLPEEIKNDLYRAALELGFVTYNQ